MTETPAPKQPRPRRPWHLEFILGVVALGVAYIALSLAIDSGALLHYAFAVLFFGLGIRHFVLLANIWSKKRG